MAKNKQEDSRKTSNKILQKEEEQKPVPFDELLLKALAFKPKAVKKITTIKVLLGN